MEQLETLAQNKTKAIYLRAWVEADGITIPAIAKGEEIQVSDRRIIMVFSSNSCELYATAVGKRYTIQDQVEIMGNFVVKNGKLIPEVYNHKYGEIKSDLARNAGAYHGNSENPIPIKVVEEITGKDQIKIEDGGVVTLSNNLANILVKVIALPIVFPKVVSVSATPVENFVIKIVCSFSGELHLAVISQCKLIPEHQEGYAQRRRVEFEYDMGNVKIEKLKAG
jgi:hypothetical protein